jgi:hypothetical protein
VGLSKQEQYHCHRAPHHHAKLMRKFKPLKAGYIEARWLRRKSLQKFARSSATDAVPSTGLFTILLPAAASFLNPHCIYGTWSWAWADPA